MTFEILLRLLFFIAVTVGALVGEITIGVYVIFTVLLTIETKLQL